MDPWLIGDLVLLGVGTPITLWIASRGDAVDRLVGLEMCGVIASLALLASCEVIGESSYLIVPLLTAVLSFVGTLVFTRLLAPRP